jgi:hypothetical protein
MLRCFDLLTEQFCSEASVLLAECIRNGRIAGAPTSHQNPFRTATLVISSVKWRYPAVRSESRSRFMNGLLRSVNRKVQGSNPCSGAKI